MHAYTYIALDIANDRARAADDYRLAQLARSVRVRQSSWLRRVLASVTGRVEARAGGRPARIASPRRSTLGPVRWD